MRGWQKSEKHLVLAEISNYQTFEREGKKESYVVELLVPAVKAGNRLFWGVWQEHTAETESPLKNCEVCDALSTYSFPNT